MTIAELALLVSGLAFVVSIASLWVNSLRPFKLKLSHDAPTFKLYKITPNISGSEEQRTWWIPSFDIGVSFYNVGRIAGELLDIRIVAKFEAHRSDRTFTFYPKWIVDYSRFQKDRADRFTWLDTAILRDWYPFMLGSQSEKNLHVVLESDRWDHRESGEMTLTFEVIASDTRRWRNCATYKLAVSKDMFEGMSCYTAYNENIERLRKINA